MRLARALHDKHPSDPVYAWWARLGGTTCKNVERDLRRRSRDVWDHHLEPFYIPITLASADGEHGEQHQLATLAPYEMFSAIHSFGAPFGTAFLGDDGPDGARDYWTEFVAERNVYLLSGCLVDASKPSTMLPGGGGAGVWG